MNDEAFEVGATRSYSTLRSSGQESTTVKIQFIEDGSGR